MADDGESSGAEDSCRLLITIDSWLLRSKPQEPVPTEIATTIGDLSPPGDDDDVLSPTSPAGPRKNKKGGHSASGRSRPTTTTVMSAGVSSAAASGAQALDPKSIEFL